MYFTFLTGDLNFKDYGGKWISDLQHNAVGGYNFAYVIDLINIHECTGETDGDKYNVSVEMVAPSEVSQETKQRAVACYCEDEAFDDMYWERQISILSEYGTTATLESYAGNNFTKLLNEAKAYCKSIDPNDVLDNQANQIGSTNRDFLRGDSLAGMERHRNLEEVTKAVTGRNEDNTAVEVNQSKLTSDCFIIQMFGPDRCKTCEYRDNHEECGGMEIRKKLKMV